LAIEVAARETPDEESVVLAPSRMDIRSQDDLAGVDLSPRKRRNEIAEAGGGEDETRRQSFEASDVLDQLFREVTRPRKKRRHAEEKHQGGDGEGGSHEKGGGLQETSRLEPAEADDGKDGDGRIETRKETALPCQGKEDQDESGDDPDQEQRVQGFSAAGRDGRRGQDRRRSEGEEVPPARPFRLFRPRRKDRVLCQRDDKRDDRRRHQEDHSDKRSQHGRQAPRGDKRSGRDHDGEKSDRVIRVSEEEDGRRRLLWRPAGRLAWRSLVAGRFGRRRARK